MLVLGCVSIHSQVFPNSLKSLKIEISSPCLYILSNGADSLSARQVAPGRRSEFMINNVDIIM